MKLVVKLYGIEIASVCTNHSMSIEDVLELEGADIDQVMADNGIDDWEYGDIELAIE